MSWIKRFRQEVSRVVLGKEEAIKMALVTLISRGHLLIEDVPGVGKTTLALCLARATDCAFRRIQFTSDLLPSDILGVNIYNPESREFEFRPGPIFSNIVLADEINRTNPKTQSALLEAMNERRVSIEGKTMSLDAPFMVIATQNPLEYHGTFPLPESQLDRFMMHLRIGYPSYDDEKRAVVEMKDFEYIETLKPVVTRDEILQTQGAVRAVRADDSIVDYVMQTVRATRSDERIRLGVSTRGAKYLLTAARGAAFYEGRDYVLPEDVKAVFAPVLAHRIMLKTRGFIRDAEEVLDDILDKTPVPV
jgi:MoxR-like ATPase